MLLGNEDQTIWILFAKSRALIYNVMLMFAVGVTVCTSHTGNHPEFETRSVVSINIIE